MAWTVHSPDFARKDVGNTLTITARRRPPDLKAGVTWQVRIYVNGNPTGYAAQDWCVLAEVFVLLPVGTDQEATARQLDDTVKFWTWPLARDAGRVAPVGIDALADEKSRWSLKTFGPGKRTRGLVEHIRRELDEILANPDDLTEPVDVILLAMDLYARAGGKSLLEDLRKKHNINTWRTWPAPESEDHPAEHDRGTP
jgi:hypothetical protein